MRSVCALAMTLVIAMRPAVAEHAAVEVRTRPVVSTARRALAVTAAVVPGFFLRGIGSFVVGEKRVGKRLAVVAGSGVVVATLAGLLVGGSGGNPYTIPAVPLVLAGGGAFITTWAADIWTAAGGDNVCSGPLALPRWSVEVGETWLKDAYRGRLHGRVAGRAALGRVDVGAAALLHVGGDGWLGFADARVRILGSAAGRGAIGDGSKVVARIGGRLQRDDDDRVSQHVGELELMGRLDLRHVDRMLRATFVELSTGIGAVRVTYAGDASELDSILLGRIVWGVYLPTGEASVFYDHRRDGLAGGIAAWRASGFVGSVGVGADVAVYGPWALRGELQIGNAWLTTAALSYRGGTR